MLDPSYAAKTLDELQAEFVQSGQDLAVLSNHRQDLLAEIDKRKAAAKVAARVEQMSDLEKEALKKALESRPPEA